MAITPVGNNGFNYIPGQMAGQTGKVGATVKADKPEINTQGCQTWQSRKYVDRSNDPSVSFQSPTHLSTGEAALAVAAHENEHVVNNAQKAEEKGMVAHSTVTLSYGICPECGRTYVAGGTTKTTFTPKQQTDEAQGVGGNVNTFA